MILSTFEEQEAAVWKTSLFSIFKAWKVNILKYLWLMIHTILAAEMPLFSLSERSNMFIAHKDLNEKQKSGTKRGFESSGVNFNER